jgi:transglutaminase-like putative cysteine protease
MRYCIQHKTHYRYQHPVVLRHHTLQLRPRSDGSQKLLSFQLDLTPLPQRQASLVDVEGNAPIGVWFDPRPTQTLSIVTTATVETYRSNPFDYLATPGAITLPFDYSATLAATLYSCRQGPLHPAPAPGVVELAQTLWHQVDGDGGLFLTALTQRIYETCQYITRPMGRPWPPGITWANKQGSCRDLAVLFMEACRCVGLAARFVSGYEEGDSATRDRDLHGWAEVYIPGGGWRGFDPTHGLAVADRHIALVASAFPDQTVPVIGSTEAGARITSTLDTEVQVTCLGDP